LHIKVTALYDKQANLKGIEKHSATLAHIQPIMICPAATFNLLVQQMQ